MRCDAVLRYAMRCDAMRCDAMRCDAMRWQVRTALTEQAQQMAAEAETEAANAAAAKAEAAAAKAEVRMYVGSHLPRRRMPDACPSLPPSAPRAHALFAHTP
jgi:hypothetical protein